VILSEHLVHHLPFDPPLLLRRTIRSTLIVWRNTNSLLGVYLELYRSHALSNLSNGTRTTLKDIQARRMLDHRNHHGVFQDLPKSKATSQGRKLKLLHRNMKADNSFYLQYRPKPFPFSSFTIQVLHSWSDYQDRFFCQSIPR